MEAIASRCLLCLQLPKPLQTAIEGRAGNHAALRILRAIKAEHWAKLNAWALAMFGIKQLVTRGAEIQAIHAAERIAQEAGVEVISSQVAKQAGKSVAKEAGKSAAREVSNSAAREAGKSAAREAGKSAAREASKSAAKERSKAVGGAAGKAAASTASINVSETIPFVGGAITAGVDTYFVVAWATGNSWQILEDAATEL